ncbi:MAG: VOC family protein [Chloroflexota bacterium]|nr:VOC family protein [Chloroflexota bacterium]
MKSHFGHSQINVGQENLSFYRDLVGFLGWETILDGGAEGGFFVARGERDAVLIFNGHANEAANDYDGLGTNHFAFGVNAQADVDAVADYLRERSVAPLFETPRHRPEVIAGIGGSREDTYYQVMFASPDNLLFEVVYTGPKA